MVSRTAPFPQLIAGFKSRPHVSPWLRPQGLYLQRGSYPCRLTCCPSGPAYLPPRLSSPSCILPSPSRSTVVSLAVLRRICASADGATHARQRARRLAYIVSIRDGARRLARWLARVASADLRFGGWFDSRRVQNIRHVTPLGRELPRV